jgi:hypothetical protein
MVQMEVVVPFFMGTLDVSDTYCDDYRKIAIKYLTSPSGFWFDFLTSLPWSFNDLYTIQVSQSLHITSQRLHCLLALLKTLMGLDKQLG